MGGLSDKHINYMRKRKWLDPYSILGLGPNGTDGITLISSTLDVSETLVQLSSFGFNALKMSADAGSIGGALPCPYDLDPKFPVGFAVWWAMDHDGSGTGAATWILLQGTVKRGIVIAAATAALDTVLVADTNTTNLNAAAVTDYLLQVTPRGIRNSIGLTRAEIEEGALITLDLEMDAADNETNIYLLGIMMDYAPMLCQGIGSEADAPLAS
jgi:hypothetical protein